MDSTPTTIPEVTRKALEFEKSQWANGSVHDDPFYSVEKNAETATASAGTLLKIEKTTDTSLYTLPPATALSRIIYQSKTLSGELIPVSAFILWPHTPRSTSDGYQVVVWAHGTSGASPNAAPSHIKNLWQHFNGPYSLAVGGYVVIATDYAGLGVSVSATSKPINFEYLAFPGHANDVMYSVQAAQGAFPELSKSFVVAGHSQGGGVAWGVAQRQAVQPVAGYLGSIAFAPLTDCTAEHEPFRSIFGAAISPAIEANFPDFYRADILTAEGVERTRLIEELDGSLATALSLLMGIQLTKPEWTENSFVKKFIAKTSNGGKLISGPLLVIHGEADMRLNVEVATAAVEETAKKFPDVAIKLLRVEGVDHDPVMASTQWVWMDWIAKRFEGMEMEKVLKTEVLKTAMPVAAHQRDMNWYIAPSSNFWERP